MIAEAEIMVSRGEPGSVGLTSGSPGSCWLSTSGSLGSLKSAFFYLGEPSEPEGNERLAYRVRTAPRTGLLKGKTGLHDSKINISSRFGFKRKDRKEREGKRQGEDSSPRPLHSQNVKDPLRHGASARRKMRLYATRPSSFFCGEVHRV